VALSLTSEQMIWLKRALKKLRYDVSCALFTDSTEAKDIVENSKINKRTKHIDKTYHYTREKLLEEEFFLFHISSAQNHANLMIKSLGRQLYDKHTKLLSNSEKKCWNLSFIQRKDKIDLVLFLLLHFSIIHVSRRWALYTLHVYVIYIFLLHLLFFFER
jgi:hypothetical protein